MTRDEQQKDAFNKYRDNKCAGSIIAGTGFGKTRVGVYAVVHALLNSEHDALVLVPFSHLKENFKGEMIKAGYEEHIPRVQFECYASVKKLAKNPCTYSVLVCDEIHLGLTDICFSFYRRDLFERKMFLTATLPENPLYKSRLYSICPPVFEISIDACVDKGFVAPYTIKCVKLELIASERKKYKTVNSNYGYWMSKMGCNNGGDGFSMAKQILANTSLHEKEKIEAAIGFYRAIRQRKEIIDHAQNKITLAKIITENTADKLLVFGGDNGFTDRIAGTITGSVTYHSGKGKKVKDAALKDFKSGKSKVLCSTKALNQGLDVPDASVGVICGITSKALTMIQRVGRLIRIDPDNPDKKGEIIVLYVENSQEEKWLRNALKEVNQNNVVWTTQQEMLIKAA